MFSMRFGWINLFGAGIVAVMLIPNIIYAVLNKNEQNICKNRFMNVIEQIGRYASITLMWLPLFVWEFGFSSVAGMILYFIGNAVFLSVYLIEFIVYFKKKTYFRAVILSVLPPLIFAFSGLILRHWALVCFALLFAFGHIYVTKENLRSINEINIF